MKIYRRHISIALLTTIFVFGLGHVAHAQLAAIASLFGYGLDSFIIALTAEIVNMGLSVASWFLAISGLMLNVSMNITLNIKSFVDSTPAIFTVWKSIRDISGMFIIFMLLFAAIRMILAPIGVPAQNMGQLIKTVVIAGILINFSFFVAGLGIDLSNIVSMQLYNTIAPAQKLDNRQMLSADNIKNAFKQGGISDIFMSSLKITSIYDPKTLSLTDVGKTASANSATGVSPSLKIILIGIVGFMIMITAAFSFAMAAMAFTVRFIILLFLLAFSPIWFASYAIPDLQTYAKKWTDLYKGQMLFMPVYLLLMYFAMSVLISNNMVSGGFAENLNLSNSDWYSNIFILAINAALVIMMLNAPLLAAMSIMGKTPAWANNLGAGALWKKVGGWAAAPAKYAGGAAKAAGGAAVSYAGRNTIGWAGSKANKYLSNTKLGNTLAGRAVLESTVGKVAGGKFGGSMSYADNKKAQRDVDNKLLEIKRGNEFKALTDPSKTVPPKIGAISSIIDKMSEKEKLALGAEELLIPEVIINLKDSDFEAIKKDVNGDFTEGQRTAIAEARKTVLKTAAEKGDHEAVKKMLGNMKDDSKKSLASTREEALKSAVKLKKGDVIKELMADMDGKELYKIYKNNVGLITSDDVIVYLTPSQIKKLADEGMEDGDKRILKSKIISQKPAHKGVPTVSDHQFVI